MNKVFLDTDVIINILRKQENTLIKLKKFIKQNYKFYISPIVIAEIYAGARKNELEEIEELFSFFEILNINSEIGYITGNYANKYKKAFNKISLEDYMIAATVKYFNIELWTYNKKHYPMDDIKLV